LIYQRQRTKPKDIAFSLYLYFLALSYRNTTARALDRFVLKSHHVSIWKRIQKYKPQQKISSKTKKRLNNLSLMKLSSRLVNTYGFDG
jgi:hypothetical protein